MPLPSQSSGLIKSARAPFVGENCGYFCIVSLADLALLIVAHHRIAAMDGFQYVDEDNIPTDYKCPICLEICLDPLVHSGIIFFKSNL